MFDVEISVKGKFYRGKIIRESFKCDRLAVVINESNASQLREMAEELIAIADKMDELNGFNANRRSNMI